MGHLRRVRALGFSGVAVGVFAAASLVPLVDAAATTSYRCASLADAPIARTTITDSRVVPGTGAIPEHCLVDGYITTPGDATVPSNRVGFRVGLPTRWNRDFFFQGVGAFAGRIGPLDAGLTRGYASASTDTGHQGSGVLGDPVLDGSWALGNRPRQIDWAYRGTHVATVAAKALVHAYYGRQPRHAFFSGCSNGGRQGLMEAQRYPGDYDAIVADAPALDVIGMFTSWIWQSQAQLAEPGAWLPPEALATVSQATLADNDARDGVVDGLIGGPRRASFDPGELEGEGPGTLSAAQVEALRAIYAGATTSTGERLAGGRLIGHEEGWASFVTGSLAPEVGADGHLVFPFDPSAPFGYSAANEFLRYFVFGDPSYDLTDFDLDADGPAIEAFRTLLDATSPDLRAFAARGGRLLVTHGWADPALDALTSIRYHDDVVDLMGRRRTDDFFRLFMVPGMFHCGGGPGTHSFDALTAMERWVRDGVAPEQIVASNPETGRTRPLCPYPQAATYRGHGSIDVAASFRCQRQGAPTAQPPR